VIHAHRPALSRVVMTLVAASLMLLAPVAPALAQSSGSSNSTSSAQAAADAALDQVGTPYRWGGATPAGFDCSGLTSYAYAKAGVTIPRTSRMQYSETTSVSRSSLRPGDLVFYNSPVSHVAIYIGDGEIVESPRSGLNVRVRKLADRTPTGYGRP
jgi:peptidoglycan DL-endopeptidase CwlO